MTDICMCAVSSYSPKTLAVYVKPGALLSAFTFSAECSSDLRHPKSYKIWHILFQKNFLHSQSQQ